MKISEAKKLFEDYEELVDYLSREVNDYVKLGLVEKSPFFHGYWTFEAIHFDDGLISFVDDDWNHGYDLHDYAYTTAPISLFLKED